MEQLCADKRIDAIADLNAAIALYQAKVKRLKDELVAKYGVGSIYGMNYKASIAEVAASESVDYKAVSAYLAERVSDRVYQNALKKSVKVKKSYIRLSIYDVN